MQIPQNILCRYYEVLEPFDKRLDNIFTKDVDKKRGP